MADEEKAFDIAEHKAADAGTKATDSPVEYAESVRTHRSLKRQLKNRHVVMISIGGVIGTGLFLGTATSLSNGGPVGLLLAYMVMGTICYSVMISVGEMIAFLPIAGGHIKLAERFVDPAFSFSMGWNYWYSWNVTLPAELSAASVLVNFWNKSVNNAAWISIFLIVVITINMFGAGAYGECEFIFASIKVVTITGLIILGIILDLGGGSTHDRLGFRYWRDPGPFVQFQGIGGASGQFLGWWSVMTQAAFSFVGTEVVAIAAGEAKNPRRNLIKAIRRVYIRILLFYIGGTFIIGLIVPSNDPNLTLGLETAAGSPFVIAITRAQISFLPHICILYLLQRIHIYKPFEQLINACLLTSAWSAGSSDLYSSSRALYALSLAHNAPSIFSKTSKSGLPYVSVMFSSMFGLLAYMGINKGSGKVFGWLQNLTSISGLVAWFGICVIYLRFRQGFIAQGLDRSLLPYKSKLQPYAAWYVVIMCPVICVFSGFSVFLKGGWDTATFITNYLPFILFPLLYIGSLLWLKTKPIAPLDMDFVSGLKEIEADSYDEPLPKNWVEQFWAWLM